MSIDPGSNCTGIYIKCDNIEYITSIKPQRPNRLKYMFERFDLIVSEWNITYALLEDYAYGDNLAGKRTLSEIEGVIKCVLEIRGIPCILVPISTWKSFVNNWLPKKKNKNYLQTVKEYYGKQFATTDEADAFMIYNSVEKMISGIAATYGARRVVQEIKETVEKINVWMNRQGV